MGQVGYCSGEKEEVFYDDTISLENPGTICKQYKPRGKRAGVKRDAQKASKRPKKTPPKDRRGTPSLFGEKSGVGN